MAKIDDSVKKKVPELRFPGFTDDWEERKLGEFSDVRDGTHASPKYVSQGHPMVTSKNLTHSGLDMTDVSFLTDEDFNEINKRSKVSIGDILFGMIGTIGNPVIVDRDDFAIKNVALIKEKTSNPITNKWLLQYLKSPSFNRFIQKENAGGTQKFIALGLIRDMKLRVPEFDEQQKIGSFFKQLDDTIVLHQRKLDLLKEQKKGYLQKMFPKNGAKVPELRFKGFTGDWEERKLGELVEQIIREVPKPNKPYYRMSVRSHAKGTFKQFVDNPENVAMDKLFVVKKDDLVVNITFAWEHAIAVVNEENDGLLVSHRFPTYRADGKSDIEFLHHVVSKENFRRKLEFISPGGAGRNRVLNKKDFLKLKIFVPKIEEQQKIGSFFKQLDNTIALHQRKLDLLKEQKKGFLQKMFS